ncbi:MULTISPECIES: S8 family serine peptidase [Microbacterium]|uniref:S8 family serine peptidase n=1 Tax=Microbacterium TaxID=33882 RepID=UPI0027857E66|nr:MULTISPECIES: S8 family serine peptidase [Microbacterium]MDQ1082716.1 subtilisin family serine protease [Microbacterium sp. SORGH_AS_0344]MDQ1168513.1 subtilisin family serine protease [Microbacterium proteolyticum]
MGRTLRSVTAIAVAGLFTAAGVTPALAAEVGEGVTPPTPIESATGSYIVVLDDAPVATYDGGVPGFDATKSDDARLDPTTPEVREYSAFLEQRQQDVAREVGVQADATYTVAVNGFSAQMDPNQAAKLAATDGVLKVVPDEIRHPHAVPSTEFLGLEGDNGVWQRVGGTDAAGEGVVVGVIDTGIAPENPSFAGDPLGTTPGDEPYIDGNDVVYRKADGTDFRSARVAEGNGWSSSDYTTKLVGAKYFDTGAAASGFTFEADYRSPRDGDTHGSHTAGTAAGNNGVDATVEGLDFGAVSGVAPAAKVAAYKACWAGPDPLVTSDDVCALSDLLGAINAAVTDGVDVINYSIGGGAASSTFALEDQAFFNAAAAGIFVAVSAGNSGPGASTADHASPWYTTVAASTIPTYEGTVTLPNGFEAAGASISVPADQEVMAPVVYAGDVAASGADPAQAALCFLGTLDPAKVAGKIVVCDRGQNARVEKSEEVKNAGGVGMILVNVTPASVDNDFHSVPTVHLDAQYRDALLSYVRETPDATATLIGENITDEVTPTPQVAGFSSRGPMLADGSDILKPDVSAPGVAILAAAANAPGADPAYEFLSGTSMSSPHVAGLAALYFGERPRATPAEVKSAMMTTAYDTVDAEGADVEDPFAQGAGHVDPTKYFDPGLLYLNGSADWAAFLQGKGLYDFGVEPIDGSDLNLASISIGSLAKPQTVTRTVTSTQAGSFTASIEVPGVDAVVEPSTLDFAAAGEEQTFTVTFTRTTAPAEQWTTGFLTWTSGDTQVRSPIAIHPATAEAPAEVSGTGASGSTNVEILPGFTGELPLTLSGLTAETLLTDADNPVEGHSGNQDSGDADGYVRWIVDVPEGTTLSRFDLDSSDDDGSDLDLFVSRVVSPDDLRYYERFTSATASADERVSLPDPTPGTYLVEANVYSFTAPFTWDMTYANVAPGGEGQLTATPNPLTVEQGTPVAYDLSWQGLAPATRYLGVVTYGESSVQTVLTVDSGEAAPVAVEAPTVSGTAALNRTLQATPGTWNPAEVTTTYQWLRDGEPIEGATSQTYRVQRADLGRVLSVRVTATSTATGLTGTADSAGVPAVVSSRTQVTVSPWVGRTSDTYKVTVRVSPAAGPAAQGDVTVTVAGKAYTATLQSGRATITLDPQTRGAKVVKVSYGGSTTVQSSNAVSAFIVLR